MSQHQQQDIDKGKEASKRPTKHRKVAGVPTASTASTSTPTAARVAQLEQELERLNQQHQQPDEPHVQEMRRLLQQREALSKQVGQLKAQSQLHDEWLEQVCYLVASSPHFDQALHLVQEQEQQQPGSAPMDIAQKNKKLPPCSKILMEERLCVLKQLSAENGLSMLTELMRVPANRFQVTFTSRGWQFECIGQGCLLTFRGKRQLIQNTLVKNVAYEFWQCTQRDDVQRTFLPAMEQFHELYALPLCSLTRRVFQLTDFANVDIALLTLDSLHLLETTPSGDQTKWLLTIESVQDSYLKAYARAALNHQQEVRRGNPVNSTVSTGATTTINPSPTPFSSSWYNPRGDLPDHAHNASPIKSLLFSVLFTQTAQGGPIKIQMTGSLHNSHQLTKAVAIELLQYLVVTMPLFEELHLSRPSAVTRVSTATGSKTAGDSSA